MNAIYKLNILLGGKQIAFMGQVVLKQNRELEERTNKVAADDKG